MLTSKTVLVDAELNVIEDGTAVAELRVMIDCELADEVFGTMLEVGNGGTGITIVTGDDVTRPVGISDFGSEIDDVAYPCEFDGEVNDVEIED